jgi:hypothetical protein
MRGRARRGRDRLEGIAALLLSLAGLAERAATRSAPVRFIVLWLLRRAEEVAADFVGAEPSAPVWPEHVASAPDDAGHGPDDALALGLSLRLLALAVQAMADAAGRLSDMAGICACIESLSRIGSVLNPAASGPGGFSDTS